MIIEDCLEDRRIGLEYIAQIVRCSYVFSLVIYHNLGM